MSYAPKALAVVGVSVLCASVWLATAPAAPASAPHEQVQCATWTDEQIPLHEDRLEVIARFSEPLGDSVRASFPDSARVQVVSVTRLPGRDAFAARLTLNTTLAVPGTWWLTMQGVTRVCGGDVYVGAVR